MSANFLERRKILKQANLLELTPVRLDDHEKDESGKVTIIIPKFTNSIAKKIIEPRLKARNIRMKLDEFGTCTWLLMDGHKNVAKIISELRKQFGDKIEPVEERLTKFITLLYEQRYISFAELKSKGV